MKTAEIIGLNIFFLGKCKCKNIAIKIFTFFLGKYYQGSNI